MKKNISLRFCLLISLVALGFTSCVSTGPVYYSVGNSGIDDYSFDVKGNVKSEGTIAYSEDKTIVDTLQFWHKYPEVVRKATPNDIKVYFERMNNGWFEISVFEAKIEKWFGKFTFETLGESQSIEYVARTFGGAITEITSYKSPCGKLEPETLSVNVQAPVLTSVYKAPNGKEFGSYLTQEVHWNTNGEYSEKTYPHIIADNSKIQITDINNVVFAELDTNGRHFKIYDCASDEDEIVIRNYIAEYFIYTEFHEKCLAAISNSKS